jgi:hypothetical protein
MSETETLEQEVETVEPSAVEELINQITAGDLNKAEGSFQSIVQDKMADALEAQRIATAQAIFNDSPEGLETDADEDLDITDEEIEDELDAVEEVMDEDEEILAQLDDDVGRK